MFHISFSLRQLSQGSSKIDNSKHSVVNVCKVLDCALNICI